MTHSLKGIPVLTGVPFFIEKSPVGKFWGSPGRAWLSHPHCSNLDQMTPHNFEQAALTQARRMYSKPGEVHYDSVTVPLEATQILWQLRYMTRKLLDKAKTIQHTAEV